jgi:hypothetical protein
MKPSVSLAMGLSALLVLGQKVAEPAATLATPCPKSTQPATQSSQSGPEVVTIHDEHIAARPTAIQDGKLVVASEPPRHVPLDDVARVLLPVAPQLIAHWIGQDNHDLVQNSGTAAGNSIQDIHIAIAGLNPAQKVKQIHVECHHPERRGIWKLDPAGTSNWRLALERPDGSAVGDLFLEPNQDNFDQPFKITCTYDDGSTAQASVKATTHVDPQLKVSTESKPAADSIPPQVLVHLEAGDRLRAELLGLDSDSIKLRTAWMQQIEIPLLHVLGIEFGKSLSTDTKQKIEQQLRSAGTDDVAVVLGQDDSATTVSGNVQGFEGGKLRFSYQGEVRSINQPRLAAIVFAAHPPTRNALAPYQVFQFATGDRISGLWNAIESDSFGVLATWGSQLDLPGNSVTDVTFRNGKMIYLSDLEPVAVEEVPYFGRVVPHRRDQNLDGGALKMKGKTYAKGLAVHSRCVLTYAIDGQFQSLKCLLGFDESAGDRGRVLCRVTGDGKELFADPDLRSGAEPKPLEVAVTGIRQLVLEVDFGAGEDTCDRVIWADARLFR